MAKRAYIQPKAIIGSFHFLNPNEEVLLSNKILTDEDSSVQKLDCGNSTYRVILPSPSENNGRVFYIMNATNGLGRIHIYDHSNLNLLDTIDPGQETKVTCIGSDWYHYEIGNEDGGGGNPPVNPVDSETISRVIEFNPLMTNIEIQNQIDSVKKKIESGVEITFWFNYDEANPHINYFVDDTAFTFSGFYGQGKITIAGSPNVIENTENTIGYMICILNCNLYVNLEYIEFYTYFYDTTPEDINCIYVDKVEYLNIHHSTFDADSSAATTTTMIDMYDSELSMKDSYVHGWQKMIYAKNSIVRENGGFTGHVMYLYDFDNSELFTKESTQDAYHTLDPVNIFYDIQFLYKSHQQHTVDLLLSNLSVIDEGDCYKDLLVTNRNANDVLDVTMPEGNKGMKISFACYEHDITIKDHDSNILTVLHEGDLTQLVWASAERQTGKWSIIKMSSSGGGVVEDAETVSRTIEFTPTMTNIQIQNMIDNVKKKINKDVEITFWFNDDSSNPSLDYTISNNTPTIEDFYGLGSIRIIGSGNNKIVCPYEWDYELLKVNNCDLSVILADIEFYCDGLDQESIIYANSVKNLDVHDTIVDADMSASVDMAMISINNTDLQIKDCVIDNMAVAIKSRDSIIRITGENQYNGAFVCSLINTQLYIKENTPIDSLIQDSNYDQNYIKINENKMSSQLVEKLSVEDYYDISDYNFFRDLLITNEGATKNIDYYFSPTWLQKGMSIKLACDANFSMRIMDGVTVLKELSQGDFVSCVYSGTRWCFSS